jgi:hypothetical protein
LEESTKLYHFTTWQLSDEYLEKIINTSWDISNYWKNKLTRGWVPHLVNLPANILVNGLPLSDLNELLNHMKYTSELLKEYIFEEIRATEYTAKPSRRNCLFAFSTALDPDLYAKQMGFDRARYRLITFRVLESTRLHYGDMVHLNTNLSDYSGMVDAARNYWTGANENTPSAEVLVAGQLQIIGIS